MNDNQMKPLQALELLMTRIQSGEDNVAKARVEFETVKSALYDLKRLQELFNQYAEDNKRMREYIDMVDKTFVDVETTKKKLKALEIIKGNCSIEFEEQTTEFGLILFYLIIGGNKIRILNPKKYYLLKEVLENDR